MNRNTCSLDSNHIIVLSAQRIHHAFSALHNLQTTTGARHNKSRPASRCRVLPPGEFSGMIYAVCKREFWSLQGINVKKPVVFITICKACGIMTRTTQQKCVFVTSRAVNIIHSVIVSTALEAMKTIFCCFILLPVSYLLMSLSSEGQNLSAKQISSTYLHPRLRYNYVPFGKTNVRHIGILLPVSISTISHNRHVILHQPAKFHPNRTIRGGNMASHQFSRRRQSAMLNLLWSNGRPHSKCILWSELGL